MHATRIYVSTTVHSRTTSKNLPVKQRLVSFVVLVLLFLRRGTRETKQKTKQKIRARVCNEPPQGTVRMSDSNYFARRRPRMGSSPARQGRSPLRIFARCALVARRRGLGHAQCHRGCSKNPPFNSATSPPSPPPTSYAHLTATPSKPFPQTPRLPGLLLWHCLLREGLPSSPPGTTVRAHLSVRSGVSPSIRVGSVA